MSSDLVERLRDTPCNREPFTAAHAKERRKIRLKMSLSNLMEFEKEDMQKIVDANEKLVKELKDGKF